MGICGSFDERDTNLPTSNDNAHNNSRLFRRNGNTRVVRHTKQLPIRRAPQAKEGLVNISYHAFI